MSAACARWFEGGPWPGGFLDRADAITARDAAYLSLSLRTGTEVRRLGGAHNLHAGFLGERRRILGVE